MSFESQRISEPPGGELEGFDLRLYEDLLAIEDLQKC